MSRFFDLGFTFVRPVPLTKDGKTALLIIDMHYMDASADQGFNLAVDRLRPGAMDYFNDRNENLVIPTIQRLLQYFRANQLPVVFVVIGSDYRDYRDVPTRARDRIRALEEQSGVDDILWTGNPGFAIRKEIEPLPDEMVVRKRTFGAFNSSQIDELLRLLGVENLVLTGVSTNACLETTARDAADRGYGCVVVDEGAADYDPEAHDASLRAFHFNFGRIVRSAQDVIDALDSGEPV